MQVTVDSHRGLPGALPGHVRQSEATLIEAPSFQPSRQSWFIRNFGDIFQSVSAITGAAGFPEWLLDLVVGFRSAPECCALPSLL